MKNIGMRSGWVCLLLAACFPQLAVGDEPEDRPWFESEHHYPYLESGELGEQPGEAEGETRVWDRRLPIWGQEVIDLGYELPLPYGVAGLLMQIEQDLSLEFSITQRNADP
jgi:hypothetical protein